MAETTLKTSGVWTATLVVLLGLAGVASAGVPASLDAPLAVGRSARRDRLFEQARLAFAGLLARRRPQIFPEASVRREAACVAVAQVLFTRPGAAYDRVECVAEPGASGALAF